MAFRGGWLSSASAVLRGASSNLAAAQTSVSTGQSFHSTAACLKQKFFGTVISDAMNKSVVVAVERLWRHPKYKKVIKRRSKIMAHAEYDEYIPGDKVLIEQCRPLSKCKAFKVLYHSNPEREAELQKARDEQQKERDAKYAERKAYFEEKKAAEAAPA